MFASLTSRLTRRVTGWPAAARPAPANDPTAVDAWERWSLVWHVIFFVSLFGPLVFVIIDEDAPVANRVLAVALSTAFAGWYWWFVLRHPEWYEQTRPMSLHLAGALTFFLALTSIHSAFLLLTNSIFIQFFTLLRLRWAVPGVLGFLGLLFWQSWRIGPQEWPLGLLILSVVVTLLFAIGLAVFINAIIDQSRDRRELIAQLQRTRRELAAEERRSGILEERQRLAREIHDTLAQQFGSIAMLLDAADGALEQDVATARRHLRRAESTAREGLEEARRLVWALRPEALEQVTLGEAVCRVARRWSSETGIAVETEVTGQATELHPEVEMTLLRAAQETLTNVRKHAGASRVTLTLSYLDDQVALDVVDDGRGFDPDGDAGGEARRDGGGFGLTAMRERAARLGGSVVVESEPARGTAISIALPARRGAMRPAERS